MGFLSRLSGGDKIRAWLDVHFERGLAMRAAGGSFEVSDRDLPLTASLPSMVGLLVERLENGGVSVGSVNDSIPGRMRIEILSGGEGAAAARSASGLTDVRGHWVSTTERYAELSLGEETVDFMMRTPDGRYLAVAGRVTSSTREGVHFESSDGKQWILVVDRDGPHVRSAIGFPGQVPATPFSDAMRRD